MDRISKNRYPLEPMMESSKCASKSKKKTFAEFFAGIGLMRMGLERAGWKAVFANDIDPRKKEMYDSNFGDCDFVLGDIHDLKPVNIPDVSLATASFPCNDLSLAGTRSGLSGKDSSAFWGFVSILRGMEKKRPDIVLLENVTGFLTSNRGDDFKAALMALNRLGYSVDALILDATLFVPQSRQRLFVVGTRISAAEVGVVSESFYEGPGRPQALAEFIFEHPEINWNIRDIPKLPKRQKEMTSILESIPHESPIWWSRDRSEYLLNQMSPRHLATAKDMIGSPNWCFGTVFRRIRNGKSMAELRTDGIAGCLRTPRGGSGRQILFKAGKGEFHVRLLSARECARLMGADDYAINVPLSQALFGFGDAVCVPVIEWLARNYLNMVLDEMNQGSTLASGGTYRMLA